MSPKKTKPRVQEEFLTIEVEDFSASVNASINPQAREPRPEIDKLRIFNFGSTIEIKGTCPSPDRRTIERYQITIYAPLTDELEANARLRDVYARDERGSIKYHKVHGLLLPAYVIPPGLGLLNRRRGPVTWDGCIWVPEQSITQMLVLLSKVQPLYLHIHVRRLDRTCWIDGLTLQTTDPSEE